jgi:hypothetical protein
MIEKRRNILLALGIDKYISNVWDDLNNAVFDTKETVKVLTERYSFELYPDPLYDEHATKENIYTAFNELKQYVGPDDNVIIFFAGHGQMNPQTHRGYWVPHDGTATPTTFIDNSVIKDFIEDIDAQHIWLISDSCFSGTFLSRTRGIKDEKTYYRLDQQMSRWMFASGGEERVADGVKGQHSPFSKYLIRYLENNDNIYTCVTEIIKYVSILTANNSRQTPNGNFIENIGHDDGEMILILNDEFVKNKLERTKGTTNTQILRLELIAIQKRKSSLSAGKELLLFESFIDTADYLIIENFRFNNEGNKKLTFDYDKVTINGAVDDNGGRLIQRFATWQGLNRYLESYSEMFQKSRVVSVHAIEEIEKVEGTQAAIMQAEVLQELFDFNADPMACLHCEEKISTNDSYLIEIDEVGMLPNVGNVHKECLRPADRILGLSAYKDLEDSHLINFNYTKWMNLLEKGQGQVKGLERKMGGLKTAAISWNPENNFNEGQFCIKTIYENGSTNFIMLGKEIHRFKKDEIDIEVQRFNDILESSKKADDPICMIVESGINGSFKFLNKLKLPEQTITNVLRYERAKYTKQYESNSTKLDNDYTPLGLILHSDSDDIVKIGNFIPLLSKPTDFEKFFKNWNAVGSNIEKCTLKIISSDLELDFHFQSFYKEGMNPVLDPIFDLKTRKLVSGFPFVSMSSLIESKKKIWREGDKVKIVFPGVQTKKYATGFLLTDEYLSEDGESCVIFQPVEKGKSLKDSQYQIPTRLLHEVD